jgi:hypothetical protein
MNKENNLMLALEHIENIAIETVSIGKSIYSINESIHVIKSLGFTTIQNGQTKAKPLANELPYAAFKTAITGKFIHLEGRAKTSAISDLRQSINFGLQNDGLEVKDSNASRAKTKAKAKTSDKKERGASTPKEFNAVKIADDLAGKYTGNQINALIIELQKLLEFN